MKPYKNIQLLVKPIVWGEAFTVVFWFEISTQQLQKFLPCFITATEIRPGVSLLGFSFQLFHKNNLGHLPEFKEISLFAMISPQMNSSMPLPKLPIYAINISSKCRPFLEHAQVDKMPIYQSDSIEIELDIDNYIFLAKDNYGPIAELAVSQETLDKEFYEDTIWGQTMLSHNNNVYIGAWKWQGKLYEYQKNKEVGKLYSHPFFAGIDVSSINTCHLQMFTPKSQNAVVTFYKPFVYRSLS